MNLILEQLDSTQAARLNVSTGWWILADGQPYVGPFLDREEGEQRLTRLTGGSKKT